MCSCEPGYTCSQCKGAPFDPMYEWDEAEPVTVEEF